MIGADSSGAMMRVSLHRSVVASVVVFVFTVSATTQAPVAPVRTDHAMVVSIQHDATDAGVEVLREGGNAVDAAVAVGFALAVVYPAAGNIGGGGFMLIKPSSAKLAGGKARFLDYREKLSLIHISEPTRQA